MDAIRLRQIEEVMGYDKHINVMVMDMERKRVSQTIREKPEDTYALIDSQKMLDVIDATNSLRLMLDGKLASLSAILRPSANVDAGAAQDVWQVEAVVSKYNEISAPFVSANGATSLQQNIMRQALELLKPIGAIKTGAHKVLNGIVSMIGARRSGPDDPLFPTLTFYFVRLAETLATYVTLYEHLRSSKLLPITPSDLTTRVWDLINSNNEWQTIAKGDFVEKLFREFHFTPPPISEVPPRPEIKVKVGIPTLDQAERAPNDPPGAGPLPLDPEAPPGGGRPPPPDGGPLPLPPPGRPGGGPPEGGPYPQGGPGGGRRGRRRRN